MKKLFFCSILMLCAGMAAAENMRFVTLLSQPVGSFASVEMLDQENPTEIFHLNFCNTTAASGKITVSSTESGFPVVMNKLIVNSEAALGGNLDNVSARRLSIALNADFTGGSLDANYVASPRVLVDDGASSSGDATFTYDVNTLQTRTASFNKMYIPGTANLKHTASESGASVGSSALSWKKITCAVEDESVCQPNAYFLTSLGSSAASKVLDRLVEYNGVYFDSSRFQQISDKNFTTSLSKESSSLFKKN